MCLPSLFLLCKIVSLLCIPSLRGLIHKGQEVTEGLLNMVEMAFRAYDPCFGCATHNLPGQMPLEVTLRDPHGRVLQRLAR